MAWVVRELSVGPPSGVGTNAVTDPKQTNKQSLPFTSSIMFYLQDIPRSYPSEFIRILVHVLFLRQKTGILVFSPSADIPHRLVEGLPCLLSSLMHLHGLSAVCHQRWVRIPAMAYETVVSGAGFLSI